VVTTVKEAIIKQPFGPFSTLIINLLHRAQALLDLIIGPFSGPLPGG